MPRSSSTVSAKAQTLFPVRFFQVSLAQVSLPVSPSCGKVWNVQNSLPVRTS